MKAKLVNKRPETEGVITFVFQPEQPITWQAGQYLHYRLPHDNPDDRGEERWFTISAAPFEKQPQVTTRLTSENGSSFKHALEALSVGDELELGEPEGDFVITDPAQQYVLIAGGIGITPLRSILMQLDHDGQDIQATLVYGTSDQPAVFKRDLENLGARHPDFHVRYILSPEHISEVHLKEAAQTYTNPFYYISGPEPMVKYYQQLLLNSGVAKDHIKIDDFPGYTYDLPAHA